MLQENGVLHKLKTKWWKQKGALNCEVSFSSTGMDPDPDYIILVSGSWSGSSKAKMLLKKAKLMTTHALKNWTYSLEPASPPRRSKKNINFFGVYFFCQQKSGWDQDPGSKKVKKSGPRETYCSVFKVNWCDLIVMIVFVSIHPDNFSPSNHDDF